MLSSVLRSPRAIAANVAIMRAFVRIRSMLSQNVELARRLGELERRYDARFKVIFDAIRGLMTPPVRPTQGMRPGVRPLRAILAGALAKAGKSSLRLYLTGRLTAELGARSFDERRLPGRQGRRALAYLALERARPVPIDELADAVWGTKTPAGAWETALSAIVSKLRAALRGVEARVTTAAGCYQLALPADAWVDVEAARRALDEAEGHVRASRFREAWGPANVAASITARPLLGGIDAEWVTRARAGLRDVRVRGLECLAAVASSNGEHPLAAQLAREVIELEPFRETGWQRLIRALADGGNRAEALRAYGQCRDLLDKELGVAPSPGTEGIVRGLRTR